VESTPGQGSLFRVILPYRDAPAARPVGVTREIGARPQAPIRVLVIDDDALVIEVIKQSLAEGFEVTTATSARDALERLGGSDAMVVILCGLMMPDMPGLAFYEALARLDAAFTTRVVFMTGGAFTVEAEEFLRRASAPCIDKPFSAEALREVVREAAQ